MKAINCLLVSLVAGTCASAALAGGDDVTRALTPKKVEKVRMVGQIGGGGFGTRVATQVDYYSNVDLGASNYIFYGTGVTTTAEHLFYEKGGYNAGGYVINPVGTPAKIGTVEFWVVASDASSTAGSTVDCTVTMEMFDHCVDWNPLSTTAAPNTCMPSGDDDIAQVSLGGWYVDLNGAYAPYNGYANGYILDTGTAGLAWNNPDGNGFLDMRTWLYNGGSPPVTLATAVYPTYNGSSSTCGYAAGGTPQLGYSVDNFYFDADGSTDYTRNERYFYGGAPAIANLMVRLGGDDGCSYDLDGDGFVSGVDIDYGLQLAEAGCPY